MRRHQLGLILGAGLLCTRLGLTAEPIVLDEELQILTVEQGVYVVVHSFPGPCNSLLVQCADREIVWVDTACTDQATQQIHQWLQRTCQDPNIIQINTGFHNDNLGGNGYLIQQGIPCYGSDLTPRLIAQCWDKTVQKVMPFYEGQKNKKYRDTLILQKLVPPNRLYSLDKGLSLHVGHETVEVFFPGPSHTLDNVVVYFENRHILFGGCMIKAMDAKDLGFSGDADVAAWPKSARKVMERFPRARIVVPGHGHWGDPELIEHTIRLCEG